ncbi:hypothetical protein VNI00_015536 [Paramarasmius palmivorus]|uniref:Uncharacterized protein n=1 Tax=Paramarasmius palmivorus TaxID=297713 RepID=A0AAW0BKM3_9AGAR
MAQNPMGSSNSASSEGEVKDLQEKLSDLRIDNDQHQSARELALTYDLSCRTSVDIQHLVRERSIQADVQSDAEHSDTTQTEVSTTRGSPTSSPPTSQAELEDDEDILQELGVEDIDLDLTNVSITIDGSLDILGVRRREDAMIARARKRAGKMRETLSLPERMRLLQEKHNIRRNPSPS